jgi:hypothetical protein
MIISGIIIINRAHFKNSINFNSVTIIQDSMLIKPPIECINTAPKPAIKLLGSHFDFDPTLNFQHHIISISSKISQVGCTYMLSNFKSVFSSKALICMLHNSLSHGHVDHCKLELWIS